MDSELSYTEVNDEQTKFMTSHIIGPGVDRKYLVIKPSDCFLSEGYRNRAEEILNFEVYPDDVWVITFPKCGTTWTQEMVWCLMNDLHFDEALNKSLYQRSPFFEFSIFGISDNEKMMPDTVIQSRDLPRPRCIKSHLPLPLLPRQLWTVKPKIVYVARDPRDAAISFYHHHRLFLQFSGSLQEFVDLFIAGRVDYAPYWNHIIDFWKLRNEPNILFNTYEDMKRDLAANIARTAKFLGKSYSDEQIEGLCRHVSFDQMKNNKSVNHETLAAIVRPGYEKEKDPPKFIRKGKAGGWKTDMTPQMLAQFSHWNAQHLYGVGLTGYRNIVDKTSTSTKQ